MEIHKPKPWHGWREFLKEYLIIVVGVLTALAAEQAVEWLHWQEKAGHGEAQIQAELFDRYYDAAERDRIEACLDGRLLSLEAKLLASDGSWTPPEPENVGPLGERLIEPPDRPWSENVWRGLLADGTVNHIDDKRAAIYARTYAQLATMRARNHAEDEAVAAFSALLHPTVLTRPERNALAREIERERYVNHVLAAGGRQVMERLAGNIPIDRKGVEGRLQRSPPLIACSRARLAS